MLPFVQLLAPARRAFAGRGAWLPRIETTRTLAASLGPPPARGSGELGWGIAHDTLLAAVEEVDAPPLIAALASEGIEIYHARQRVQTLEDMFLETTGGESVD